MTDPIKDLPSMRGVRMTDRKTLMGKVAQLLKCHDEKCEHVACVRVHWPGTTMLCCVSHALRWANVASSMGFQLQLDALDAAPQPDCQGCGCPVERCGPALWIQQRKCCPDCTHGFLGPNDEYEGAEPR